MERFIEESKQTACNWLAPYFVKFLNKNGIYHLQINDFFEFLNEECGTSLSNQTCLYESAKGRKCNKKPFLGKLYCTNHEDKCKPKYKKTLYLNEDRYLDEISPSNKDEYFIKAIDADRKLYIDDYDYIIYNIESEKKYVVLGKYIASSETDDILLKIHPLLPDEENTVKELTGWEYNHALLESIPKKSNNESVKTKRGRPRNPPKKEMVYIEPKKKINKTLKKIPNNEQIENEQDDIVIPGFEPIN
jgi:hypothetical protein